MAVHLRLQRTDWSEGTRKLFHGGKTFTRASPHILIAKSLPTCKQRNPQYLFCPKDAISRQLKEKSSCLKNGRGLRHTLQFVQDMLTCWPQQVTQHKGMQVPRKRKDSTVKLSEEVIIPVPFV